MRLAITVTALTLAASAAAAAGNPTALALQRRDCPPGAKYSIGALPDQVLQGLRGIGVHGDGVYGACDYARAAAGSLTLTFLVVATGSPAQAAKAYAAFAKELADPSKRKATLPRYGDQQLAVVDRESSEPDLLVREGSLMWELSLKPNGVKVLTRALALAEIGKFARKQKARCGC
ncbi:MAG TPA: hypothetical protein VFA66_15435 [Gaiellaceae bacterium]|nr:hypothetical protein [Gaiellaceae bacterium]